MEKRRGFETCCVILFENMCVRFVPLAVTDRAPEKPTVSPIPLSRASVQQLLITYQHIVEGAEDEPVNPTPVSTTDLDEAGMVWSQPTITEEYLGAVDTPATTNGHSHVRNRQLRTDASAQHQAGGGT